MLQLSLLWILAGLMVLYSVGFGEILASIKFGNMAEDEPRESDNQNNSATYALTFFLMVLMWPIVWLEFMDTKNQ